MTAVQRFGWFLDANLHFHTLIPNGVWQEHPSGTVTCHPLPPPPDADAEVLTARVVRRAARLLARRDADLAGDDEPDAHAHAECGFLDGFSLHAATFVAVAAADRAALSASPATSCAPRSPPTASRSAPTVASSTASAAPLRPAAPPE